ncbi:EF-P 5-aminopentanol modification-associated protein YfmF [Bacillus thuringiensis]
MYVAPEIIKKKKGFNLHLINTNKFKTNTLIFKMKAPLEEETVTKRSLLQSVLQSNTKKYPSGIEFRTYLEDLYGASLNGQVDKKGDYHIITLCLEIANEKFLNESDSLIEKAIQLLSEMILHPNVTENKFNEQTIDREKQGLSQKILSIYDDKLKYATSKLIETMCEQEAYALNENGILENLDEITAQSLYKYLKKALAEDELDLYIIGDFNIQETERIVDRYFTFSERTVRQVQRFEQRKFLGVKKVIEKQNVKQGKLHIGYRTNTVYTDEDYYALQVFNGIFGGFSHSKLFINVREKENLAYYSSSISESYKGFIFVMSGIETNKFEQTVKVIQEQMNEMKKGNFNEREISQTKAVIKNRLLRAIDFPRGHVEILYHNVIAKVDTPIDEWIAKIQAVTKDEIVRVSQKIELDTIYFLSGLEAQ